MDLGGCLDEILQVCPGISRSAAWKHVTPRNTDVPCQKVTEVDEFAVLLILDVDNTPTVLATTNRLAINDHVAF